MSYRWPALAAVVLTAIYVGFYVEVVHGQGDGAVAGWYVGALAVAALALALAASGRWTRAALGVAVGILSLAGVIGLLSVGVALLPAVAAAVLALVLAGRRRMHHVPVLTNVR